MGSATDGQIIVSRQENAIDVFFSLPGHLLPSLAGNDETLLFNSKKQINLNDFRQDTAPWGDQAFEKVIFFVGGSIVNAQAISLMMHEASQPINFNTPWDALTAVTICIAPANTPPLQLEETQSYLGFSLYPVDGREELQLDFPLTERDTLLFEVSTFVDGELVAQTATALADGGSMRLRYFSDESILMKTTFNQIFLILFTIGYGFLMVATLARSSRSPLFDA